ncbi:MULTISPECIES: nicotinamidase [unclassified Massilia]|uniref:nicotinamidase n=1 Tax=unclassified Massilia TaxID=2609279 RepID=UPI0015FFE578|nr:MULTISPECIES: nicotinamidase [unclassified Massilia]
MNAIQLDTGDALIVVDLQVDFLPGGALGVPRGDEVIEPITRLINLFRQQGLPIYASRDWHPENHVSFAERGGPWPPHCVAGTAGAAFSDRLDFPPETVIVSKADTADADAYSAFNGTGLAAKLRERGVERVVVCGLATDYCVLNTANDALENGFAVLVVPEAVRAVDVQPGDGERALAAMVARGAQQVGLDALATAATPA